MASQRLAQRVLRLIGKLSEIDREIKRLQASLKGLKPIVGTLAQERRPCAAGHCRRGWHYVWRLRHREGDTIKATYISQKALARIRKGIADAQKMRQVRRAIKELEREKKELRRELSAILGLRREHEL